MFELGRQGCDLYRATNRSEIAGCSHARFAVAVKSCFIEAQSLRTHERVHSGKKPHECLHCGKCFGVMERLKLYYDQKIKSFFLLDFKTT